MNAYLANRLGRPDLAAATTGLAGSPSSVSTPSEVSGMFNASYNVGASASVGQLSLGLMAAGLGGLLLFYLWTKGVQR